MRKRTLSLILVVAIIIGFFTLGGAIHIEEGVPKIDFNGSWEDIGKTLGNWAGDFLDGILSGIKESDTVSGLLPSTDPESPTPPQIQDGSSFQVHFIDVGQADSALILCDGKAMLIDGGNDADGEAVVSYVKKLGVKKLDLIIASHSHEDHLGGLDKVLSVIPATEIWFPDYRSDTVNEKMFLEAAKKRKAPVSQPKAGTTYTLGSAICQVIGPITNNVEDPNNTSIVVRVVYGETAFLFTGDAELEEETSILDAGYKVSCDVLKVGHHGSSSSTKYRWLREAAPTYAVISVGADNEYGHPTEDTLSRLRDAEVKVYRTDLQGHIVCVSDGKTVSFRVQKNPDANTLAA